ncbi:MAG: hypothetical protein QOE15_3322 [Acidimicrobiaceae bacterium]|nr:hypothetical protein [Acidimicrobiaceae bacterium]
MLAASVVGLLSLATPAHATVYTYSGHCRQGTFPYESATVTYFYYNTGVNTYVHISSLKLTQTNPANGAPVAPMDWHIQYRYDKPIAPIRAPIHVDYYAGYTITYVYPTFPDALTSHLPHLFVDAGRPYDGVPDCRSLSKVF